MKEITQNKKDILRQYVVSGVPDSSLKAMCKELDINEEKLREYLRGQTCALVGNEPLIYSWDIERFLNNLPVID